MFPCSSATSTLPSGLDPAAFEQRFSQIASALSLSVPADPSATRRAASLLWSVYSALQSPPTPDGFDAWLQTICGSPWPETLRGLHDRFTAIAAKLDPEYVKDQVQVASAAWLAWRAFAGVTAAKDKREPHKSAQMLGAYEQWLAGGATETAVAGLVECRGTIEQMRSQLQMLSTSPLCSYCFGLRLWHIAHMNGEGAHVSTFNKWLQRVRDNLSDKGFDDWDTNMEMGFVTAAASCCGDGKANAQLMHYLDRVLPSLARRKGVRNLDDAITGEQLLRTSCSYAGLRGAAFSTYLWAAISYWLYKARKRAESQAVVSLDEASYRRDVVDDPVHDIENEEFVQQLLRALPYPHALALRCRRVELRAVEETIRLMNDEFP